MTDATTALVYAAERVVEAALDRAAKGEQLMTVFGSTVVIPDTERHFSTAEHVTTYLGWLADTPAARAWGAGPPPTVVIDGRRRHGSYHTAERQIRVPADRFGRREMTVLHEYAHHLTAGDGHGPEFCAALIDLVSTAIGLSAGMLLREQLHLAGVEVATQ